MKCLVAFACGVVVGLYLDYVRQSADEWRAAMEMSGRSDEI